MYIHTYIYIHIYICIYICMQCERDKERESTDSDSILLLAEYGAAIKEGWLDIVHLCNIQMSHEQCIGVTNSVSWLCDCCAWYHVCVIQSLPTHISKIQSHGVAARGRVHKIIARGAELFCGDVGCSADSASKKPRRRHMFQWIKTVSLQNYRDLLGSCGAFLGVMRRASKRIGRRHIFSKYMKQNTTMRCTRPSVSSSASACRLAVTTPEFMSWLSILIFFWTRIDFSKQAQH